MDYFQAHNYLASKLSDMRLNDRNNELEEAMKQFLDDKTYRPGLAAYKQPGATEAET